MNNSFYDDKELREIDEQISEVIGAPTLVDQMQARNDKVQAAKTNWVNEFRQYWYIYLPLLVSSVFTMMLGLYMGLAPYLKTEADGSKMITFNSDWAHIFTAAVYVVAFVFVTEVAFAIFHNLFHKREDSNGTQHGTMLFGMILAGISIIGTGVSGGMVVSSTLGFLTEFKEVPPSAQRWVVSVIPTMLGLYTALFAAYKLSSRKSKAERIARENEDKLELDNQVRMRGIQAIGKRRIQAAAIKMYEDMVMRGLLSPTEADWALNSGLTLAEIEKKLGRDLTGEGRVGDVSGLNQLPAYHKGMQHYLPTPQPVAHTYTADELCNLWKKTRDEVGAIFATYNNSNHFYSYSEARGNWLPEDMTRENFGQIFDELVMENAVHPVPTASNNGKKLNP